MRNPNDVIREAINSRQYTDLNGDVYNRGMDGWFLKMGNTYEGVEQKPVPMVMLVRHHDMIEKIRADVEAGEVVT